MNEGKKTVEEVLIEVNESLGNIPVPVSEIEGIGIPIKRAINNIQLCIDAIIRSQQPPEEPEFELVKEEAKDGEQE